MAKRKTQPVQESSLPKKTSVADSNPIKAGIVVGLGEKQAFFLQGVGGINLNPERPWCVIPEDITTENYNLLRDAIALKIIVVGKKPIPMSVKFVQTVTHTTPSQAFNNAMKSLVTIYATTEEVETKKILLSKIDELHKDLSKRQDPDASDKLSVLEITRTQLARLDSKKSSRK